MRTLLARIRGLFTKDDFHAELESHLQMLVDENLRRGMHREQAESAARQSLGHLTRMREDRREARSLPQIETFFSDLRYAFRMLASNPGFTAVAVITLALGIGINTTVFTVFNAVALKPLPVSDPYNVVRLERWFESGRAGDVQYAFSYPELLHFRDQSQTLASITATGWPVPVAATLPDGNSGSLYGRLVSANYFGDLGVAPFLGRAFLPEEDKEPGAHAVVVLSYPFWRDRLHADPQALGRVLKLNDTAFIIVGIAPEEFIGTGIPPSVPDFWAPVMMQAQIEPGPSRLDDPLAQRLQILARPRAGVSVRQAQSEIAALEQRFGQTYPNREKTLTVTLEAAHYLPNTNDPRFQLFAGLMMLVVAMVLFIACANLANMLLARAAARKRELTVRIALGASRFRIVRQLLTESILIAIIGGSAGLLLSIWSTKALWVTISGFLDGPFGPGASLVLNLSPDYRVFAYTLLISIATGIVFGLSPALRFSRPDLTSGLKEEGTAFGQRLDRSRLRTLLVAGQVAISLMLLITAGLLVRGLARSQSVDAGFETRSVYMVVPERIPDTAKALSIERRLVERLGTIPQVRGVTLAERVPMLGTNSRPIETQDTRLKSFTGTTLLARVDPEYFPALGIPITGGRNFTRTEIDRAAPVAVVSELTARTIWPDENPIGRRFHIQDFVGTGLGPKQEFQVIGVAKSVRSMNLSRLDPIIVYLPMRPAILATPLVRVDGDRAQAMSLLRSAVAAIDKDLMPGLLVTSLEDGPLRFQRLQSQIFASCAVALAILALALATVGIYGVMSYLVSRQTKEIGILMALGATRAGVLRSIILGGLKPVFIGALIGVAGAAGLSSILRASLAFPTSSDYLYGVSTFDPLTFLGLSGMLACVAMLASAIPAYRAIKVDPMIALRCE
jgi:predicted permease